MEILAFDLPVIFPSVKPLVAVEERMEFTRPGNCRSVSRASLRKAEELDICMTSILGAILCIVNLLLRCNIYVQVVFKTVLCNICIDSDFSCMASL